MKNGRVFLFQKPKIKAKTEKHNWLKYNHQEPPSSSPLLPLFRLGWGGVRKGGGNKLRMRPRKEGGEGRFCCVNFIL